MKLRHGFILAAAALAIYALPASGVFAATPKAGKTTELHYCENLPKAAGDCVTAVVPAAEWAEADSAINACLEGTPAWTVAEIESCILRWNPNAVVTRSSVNADGTISQGSAVGTTGYRHLGPKRHYAKSRGQRAGNMAQASGN
jgi:hypothetical protein